MHLHIDVPILHLAGPFPGPCNTVQPSLCAQYIKYIAVLIDAPEVYVLLRADNFSLGRAKRLPFLLDRRPPWPERPWPSMDVDFGKLDLICGVRRIGFLHSQGPSWAPER